MIRFEKKGFVGILTIDRPEALNALNSATLDELYETAESIRRDEEVRCLIVTGAGKAFVAGADIAEMRSLTKEEMKEVDVQVLKGVVYISLADNMLYKSGSYEINARAAETLSKIAKIIKDYKDYDVLIEGNTDNVPISKTNIRNNWDLSALRASSVVQALQNDYGVDPKRLTAGGRGEYNPIATNDTEVGKQRNRRTQIIITPKLDEFMDLIGEAPDTDK